MPQRPRPEPAHTRLAQADLHADLPQREAARERQDEHLALERLEPAELLGDPLPLIFTAPRTCEPGLARPARAPCRGAPLIGLQTRRQAAIEGDLDDRLRKIGVLLTRRAVRPPRGAGERVALAECVQHLTADPSCRVGAEWRARVVAVPARGLHQTQHAPRDQVLSIRSVASRIERPRRDRPREAEVRDDAFVALLHIHSVLPGGTVPTGRPRVNNESTDLSTIVGSYFDRYRYPDWLRTHSNVVGRVAMRLAEAHAGAGADLDPVAVGLGGYLHDIGKSPLLSGDARDHHVLGPLVLAAEGRADLVELSRRHPVYAPRDPAIAPRTLAEKIVYYADRRAGQRVVTLEERIDEQLARFPAQAGEGEADLRAAKAIEAELFRGIDLRPEDLAGPAGSIT